MSDKWQDINVRLEGKLAQALREMKRGHDESLSEVIIRLLWKVVRQTSGVGAPGGRPTLKRNARPAPGGRGGKGAGRVSGGKGKPPAPGGRAGARFAPREQSTEGWAPQEERAWSPPRGKRKPAPFGAGAGASQFPGEFPSKPGRPARPPRPGRPAGPGKPGKRFIPREADGASEGPRRTFRRKPEGARTFQPKGDQGAGGARVKRPRKAKVEE